jgi:hypothetical protein
MPITKPNVILVNGKWSTFMYLKYAFLVRKQLCILCVVYEFPCFKGFDSIAQKFFVIRFFVEEIITPLK